MYKQDRPIIPVPQPATQPQPAPVVRPRRRRLFHWEFVSVPAAIFVAAWLIKNVPGPTFSWSDVMDTLHVSRRGEGRYTQLAVMGLALITIVYVVKIIRSK